MATTVFDMRQNNMDVNFAQVSFDSSERVFDVLTKCSYENVHFNRIVGAVTIIFTDNANDTTDSGNGDQTSSTKFWRNIPSSLSVLPSPGLEHSIEESISTTVQYEGKPRIQQKKNKYESSIPPDASLSKLKPVDRELPVLTDSEGEAILIKQEPMSPEAIMECQTKDNVNIDCGESGPTDLNPGSSGVNESQNVPDGLKQANSRNCTVCYKAIRNRKDFAFHSKAHKDVFGVQESCPVCLKTFQRRMDLIKHSFIHFSNDLYSCPVCQVKISRPDSLKRHFYKRHPASLPKLRMYLANSRHSTVSKPISEEAKTYIQNGTVGFLSKEGLGTNTVEKARMIIPCIKKKNKISQMLPALKSVRLDRRKFSSAQKMQLDVDAEGVQRVNIITEQDQSSVRDDAYDLRSELGGSGSATCSGKSQYPETKKNKKTSKCSFCWSEMTNLEDFISHMEAHKSIMKVPNTCPVCLHEFSDKMRVKRHASKHVQTAVYVCPMCRIQIPRVDSFRRHIRKVHPKHADDIDVLIKHSISPLKPSDRTIQERCPEAQNIPISSSSAGSMSSMVQSANADQMKIKQELPYDFCSMSAELDVTKIKQEMTFSTNGSKSAADPYTDYSEDQPSAEMSEFQGQFVPASHSYGNAHTQHGDGDQGERSWHLTTDEQHISANDNSLMDGPVPGSGKDSSTSVHGGYTEENPSVCSSTGISSQATFLAPKRGGYRLTRNQMKTPSKQEPSSTQSSPNVGLSSPVKKKTKPKDLSSVCFFCCAVLTNMQEFLEHARLHGKQDRNTCPVCVTDYARKLGLVRHSVNHVPSDAHICEICGTSFARRDVMLRHYRKVHKMTPNYFRQENLSKVGDSYQMMSVHDQDDLSILSFDSITAPSIPPVPGDSDTAAGVLSVDDEEDMMYSCGLCGAQYHDAQALQDHVQNHPHDI